MVRPKVRLIKVNDAQDLGTVMMISSASKSRTAAGFSDEKDLYDFFKIGNIFLIKAGEDSVGTVSFKLDEKNSNTAFIRSLAILQEHRKKGIGTETMNLLVDMIKNLGFEKVRLTVHPENEHALNIYKKAAFEKVGSIENYHGTGEPRLVLEKRLIWNKDQELT